MKLDYVFDTNILIYIINSRLVATLPQGIYGCSFITEIELLSFPALTPEEAHLIQQKLQTIPSIGLTDSIKQKTIELRKNYRLKLPDALIVATAMVNDAMLLSNDMSLQKVAGLKCTSLDIHRGHG